MASEFTKTRAEREDADERMSSALRRVCTLTRRPHGGLKEILRAGKAPQAKVMNPADGKPPPAPPKGDK